VHKDFALDLEQISAEISGVTTLATVLTAVGQMEKQLAWSDLMVNKTAHDTVIRKTEQFLLASRNILAERRKLENARLDLDRAKSYLRQLAFIMFLTPFFRRVQTSVKKLTS